jgi:hypothetical protein
MRSRKRVVVAVVVLLLLVAVAQLSNNNQCGNEQRNWQTLTFPKGDYCSIPGWLPLNPWYENANKAVCKVHDNNSGIYGTISQSEADFRFLCDYVKRSDLPWGVRHITGLLSYLALRVTAMFNAF